MPIAPGVRCEAVWPKGRDAAASRDCVAFLRRSEDPEQRIPGEEAHVTLKKA